MRILRVLGRNDAARTEPQRWLRWPAALDPLVPLALFAVLAVSSMAQKGPTFDEWTHLPSGYSYLVTGDFRMNPEVPPLAKVLAALPLLARDVEFDEAWPEWRRGEQWNFGMRFLMRANDTSSVIFAGRLPMVAIGLLLGVLIWLWSREVAGRAAALGVLCLYSITPDFLAHSGLVTTDVAVSTFAVATLYFAWRTSRRWTPIDAVLAGLSLGAALASKFSAVILFPVLLLYAVIPVVSPVPWRARLRFAGPEVELQRRRGRLALSAGTALLSAALAVTVVWASYGFRGGEPVGSAGESLYRWDEVEQVTGIAASAVRLAGRARLVPVPYEYGFLVLLKDAAEGAPAFLNGERSTRGFRHYFLVTFFLKTPLPLIAIFLFALVHAAVRRDRGAFLIAAFPLVYFAVAMTSQINIGHRHLLPIYPCLFVLGAGVLAKLFEERASTIAVAALLAWQAFGTLSLHPHYLASFNALAGGPGNGYRHLVASNLDWGQDLPGLKRWMEREGVARVHLSYHGIGDPGYYGIDYEPLPSHPGLPRPLQRSVIRSGDYVAISATSLQAVFLSEERTGNPAFAEFAERLRTKHRPVAKIGYSIFVYRMP